MKLRFLHILFFILFVSCSGPRFIKEGHFFNDIDRYFNPREEINVWLYYNFKHREQGQSGLRLQSLYPTDEELLNKANLLKRGNRILFSVVPEIQPFYNMIAVQHRRPLKNLQQYEKQEYQGVTYYQRDIAHEKFKIREVYIEVPNKDPLSFLGYVSHAEDRKNPLALFDYLAKINAFALNKEKDYKMAWRSQGISDSRSAAVKATIPLELLKKEKQLFLKVFEKINDDQVIAYFQLLQHGDPAEISLKLEPGTYFLEYLDKNLQVQHRDTISF